MNALASFTLLLCGVGVGVSMLSVLVPQKRTRRILGFVMGLFLLVSVIRAVRIGLSEIHFDALFDDAQTLPAWNEADYNSEVAQYTADALVEVTDELLREEGIIADDIRLSVKISSGGRIYADRIVIYMNEAYRSRKGDIEAVIYRNLSKEPIIYVNGQEAQRADNG